MSSAPSQAFRAQSSSKIISIPTRYDPKSKQHVVLLTDIVMSFKDFHLIMCNGENVVLLTDENLEYLKPLRIAHYPGVILDVVVPDGNQGGSSSMGVAAYNLQMVGEPSAATSIGAVSVAGDVASLRIRETDDSNARVLGSQDSSLEMALQPLSSHSQLKSVHKMTQQDRLHQLHLRVDALLGRIQQSEQEAQENQQQMKVVLERTQQTDQQMQNVLGKMQESDQRMQKIHETTQETDRRLEEVRNTQEQVQKVQSTQQQMKESIDTALRTLQQLDQRTQGSQQHTQVRQEQLQQHLNEALERIQQMDERIYEMERLLSKQRRQNTLQAFHYFTFVQCRAQALLTTSFKTLPVPRLFIVLLEPTDAMDGQGRSCLLQLRLRFLCECDAQKMIKKCNGLHEIHLVNHPGYDLVNQIEFIDKFGSYLLTILYMIKYGTKAGGSAVLPLLGLKEDDEDEPHLQYIKKNISGLVDDTITYLESAINATDRRTDTPTHQSLDSLELKQLIPYLKGKDSERTFGYLRPVTTQDGHCAWVCFDHILEYYEPAFQQLKYTLSASGGVCDNNQVQLKTTSATKTKQLYDAIGNARFVQSIGDWQPLTYLGLEVSHSSPLKPASDIDSALKSLKKLMQDVHGSAANGTNGNRSLNDLELLSLDFGRLSMIANGISRGVVGDVTMEVPRLSDLIVDDLEFIRQCQPDILKIMRASQETDEARLVDILRHSTKLKELHVGCSSKRAFKLINSILSTRERTLQLRGQSTLRTLEVTREGLVPPKQIQEPCSCDQYTVAVTVSFFEDSRRLEMHVHLSSSQLDSDDTAVCDFFRQFGWAIKTLGAPYLFSDRHAKQLDESTQAQGSSMLEHLDIAPVWLTEAGLNAMDRVAQRSPNFTSVRLTLNRLEESEQIEKALVVLRRYKDQLKSLRLTGDDKGWLMRIVKAFPAKDDFPVLESLCGEYGEPWKANNPGLIAWVRGAAQPSRAFCSASIGKVGDKGLLHQWAYQSGEP